jgi:hypothetical protein
MNTILSLNAQRAQRSSVHQSGGTPLDRLRGVCQFGKCAGERVSVLPIHGSDDLLSRVADSPPGVALIVGALGLGRSLAGS